MRVAMYSRRKTTSHDPDLDPTQVGQIRGYGAGRFTGHPVGLVVVVGVLVMGLWALPEARWFLGSAVLLGGIWGFFLWLRHR
jgi:hypothetical protein